MRHYLVITLLFLILSINITAQEKQNPTIPSKPVPLPPLSHGGLMGLWYHDHVFVAKEFGEFELLNFKNLGYMFDRELVTKNSWKLFVLGNFIDKGISYATLARLKNRSTGYLLLFFKWPDSKDTTQTHGVFHTVFLNQEKSLLRTVQSTSGDLDTLEVACPGLDSCCIKFFYDVSKKQICSVKQ
jgi:hypothetical protein